VNLRIDIRIVRFCRSTYDVEMCLASGAPCTGPRIRLTNPH
jgi:hypothetical protein